MKRENNKNMSSKIIHIYSDESRHKNERFLLLGGIWIEEEKIKIANSEMATLRRNNGYKNSDGEQIDFLGEFKWTKVSKKYLPVYQQVIDLFFDWIDRDIIRSCIMLVDTHNPIILKHSNIDKEGYFKLLYQMYLHNSRIPATYKIYPDSITNPKQRNVNFEVLDKCLEAAFQSKFSGKLNPADEMGIRGFVNNITPIDSKRSQFIQMIDVVMGAVGYYQNRFFKISGARKAKVELMEYTMNKLIYSGSVKFTGKQYLVVRSTRFNIWLFRPRNKNSPD